MAELNVEKKKNSSLVPWLLLALGVVALIIFLSRRADNDATATRNDTNTAPIAADRPAQSGEPAGAGAAAAASAWDDVDRNAPAQSYPEVTDKSINVRGTANYSVYDLGEDVLFDKEKSEIKQSAMANLKEVAASIKQRFDQGPVRLYGFTDSQGDAQFNQQLAEQRAESVKKWLTENGDISADRISVQAVGEANPKASNSTTEGRKENRRVQIVARKA